MSQSIHITSDGRGNDRYREVMNAFMGEDRDIRTPQEIAAGWHFCEEFDFLLIGPGMMETGACDCDFD